MDLFDNMETLPNEVLSILNSVDDDKDGYSELDRLLDELKPLGYTFDYYLDAVPYNLRKL